MNKPAKQDQTTITADGPYLMDLTDSQRLVLISTLAKMINPDEDAAFSEEEDEDVIALLDACMNQPEEERVHMIGLIADDITLGFSNNPTPRQKRNARICGISLIAFGLGILAHGLYTDGPALLRTAQNNIQLIQERFKQ
jgi:hypothetical protein